jgi:hypothetical protein
MPIAGLEHTIPVFQASEYSTGFRPRCALTISPFTFRRKNQDALGYAMSSIHLLLNPRERDKPTISERRRKRMKQGYRQLPKAQRTLKSCRLYQNPFYIYVYLQINCLVGTSFRPLPPLLPAPALHVRQEASSSIDCGQTRPAHLRKL